MHQKMLKITMIGAAGFVVTYATLAMVTRFLILPSLTVGGLLMLAAIASYGPPNGIPIALSLTLLLSVFTITLFVISSAFSAAPQHGGSPTIPLVATFSAFVALTIFGYRRASTIERRR